MVTRYYADYTGDLIESETGYLVEHTDYEALQDENVRLRKALKPFADKWLYPDDLIADGFDIVDADYSQAANDDTLDECWIKRGWIRAARLVLGKE